MLEMVWAFMKGMRDTLIPLAAGIGGLILGLIIGWVLWPVQWTDAGPEQLRAADYQRFYLTDLAAVYASSGNAEYARSALSGYSSDEARINAICSQASAYDASGNPQTANSLRSLATVVDGNGCNNFVPATAEAEGFNLLRTCGWGILLLLLLGLLLFLFQRLTGGGGAPDFEIPRSRPSSVPTAPPSMSVDESGESESVTPIASYRTTYTFGMDAYDDSFSIESANGDFLGECGVGISEVLNSDSPKQATAMEVWLFDKNDIRTITKVAMSEHAFNDEAIRAKMAPKGEHVLAQPGEVIVLETEALIINAKITDMEYGDGAAPPNSYFERFSIELSAWSKDGAAVAAEGDVSFDDMF